MGLTQGQWTVQLPAKLQYHAQQQGQDLQTTFSIRTEVFGQRQDMQSVYAAYIAKGMQEYEDVDSDGQNRPRRIAACIMEPVLQVLYESKAVSVHTV